MSTGSYRLWLHGARQIVQVCANGERFLRGATAMNSLKILEAKEGEGLSIIVDSNGKIDAVGTDSEIQKEYTGKEFQSKIDASGKIVLPGLVDCHTHSIWVGDRVHEFAMKLAGATYLDIMKAGGGISFTAKRVSEATQDELYTSFKERAQKMMRCGTTTLECKSGYGLDFETECKMLTVMNQASQDQSFPVRVVPTYLGAHGIPHGKSATEYAKEIVDDHIPKLAELNKKGELSIANIDVFCDKGVYEIEETRRILEAGRAHGWLLNFHAEEFFDIGGAGLGASLGARAISHLEQVSEAGIQQMAASNTAAVLLPTTAYMLKLPPPPVRRMIDLKDENGKESGIIVAIGTDFNPNAYCYSMPLAMHMACILFRMTMNEALAAATINSAYALGSEQQSGSIEKGKNGDLLVIDAPKWEHLIYQFGGHEHLITEVFRGGKLVHLKPSLSTHKM